MLHPEQQLHSLHCACSNIVLSQGHVLWNTRTNFTTMQLCRAAWGVHFPWIASLFRNSNIPLMSKTWRNKECIIAGCPWQALALSCEAAGSELGQ